MNIEELDYKVPKELVAAEPAKPRDAARLLVMDKKTGKLTACVFRDLGHFLTKGDVLVFNETKVFPARVLGTKETGGKIEVVFLNEKEPKLWEVMIGGKVQIGSKIYFGKDLSGVVKKRGEGEFLLAVNKSKNEVYRVLDKIGQMPLPPYIKRLVKPEDKEYYQTVFAKETGSAAAPTASLHFTRGLIEKLKEQGIQIEYVTLHVGLGTFAPIKTERVEDHPIHAEYFRIESGTAKRINVAKKEGRRIIAVGTTVARALESAIMSTDYPKASRSRKNWVKGKNAELLNIIPQNRTTNLFIYPGYRFRLVDGMITNFHTPKSSLLALVFAFAGKSNIQEAYNYAIKNKYRLFSYGDGMLIL